MAMPSAPSGLRELPGLRQGLLLRGAVDVGGEAGELDRGELDDFTPGE